MIASSPLPVRGTSHTHTHESTLTHEKKERLFGRFLSRPARCNRRNFAVEPILLLRERRPGFRHARIALMGRLSFRSFREMQAVLGVFPEDVRLLHPPGGGEEIFAYNHP